MYSWYLQWLFLLLFGVHPPVSSRLIAVLLMFYSVSCFNFCTFIHIFRDMYVCIYVCMYVCVCMCVYVCVYVCVNICLFMCVCVCMYVCMCVCVCHLNKML